MKQCPLCHSRERILLYTSTRKRKNFTGNHYLCTSSSYGDHGPIYQCLKCKLVFVVDRIPISKIIKSYSEAEDPVYLLEEKARAKTFTRHLHYIGNIIPRGRLLDVGAYTGFFLSLAKDAGWQVEGIEPSKWAVNKSKFKYNISLKNGILKKGYFPPHSFDMVTMWDVVEHFTDPQAALETCFYYLKPGGFMCITTIDVESTIAKVLGPKWPWFMRMHLVYFSRDTIAKMLEKTGFTNITFRRHIRYISIRYLISRISPHHRYIQAQLSKISQALDLQNKIIPFHIGDLFDVYAQKPKT